MFLLVADGHCVCRRAGVHVGMDAHVCMCGHHYVILVADDRCVCGHAHAYADMYVQVCVCMVVVFSSW